MKIKTHSLLFTFSLLIGGMACADTAPAQPSSSQAKPNNMSEQEKFELKLRDERVAFNKKLAEDRVAFVNSLKIKSPEEQKTALTDFNNKQAIDRSSFTAAQMKKRNEFNMSHGMPPMPSVQTAPKPLEKRPTPAPAPNQ